MACPRCGGDLKEDGIYMVCEKCGHRHEKAKRIPYEELKRQNKELRHCLKRCSLEIPSEKNDLLRWINKLLTEDLP